MAQKDKLDLGEEKKPPASKKILFLILGAVLLTLAAVFGTLYFLGIFPPKTPPATPGANQEATAHPGEEAAKTGEAGESKNADEADSHHGSKKHGGEDAEHPIIYEDLEPSFSVNFPPNPEARVLQVNLSVAGRDPVAIEAVKKHLPMIRNNLLLLMSAADPAALKTLEGKEELRAQILDEINAIVRKQARIVDGIEEIYFTGFIMQ